LQSISEGTANLIAASRHHRGDQKGSTMLRFYSILSRIIAAVDERKIIHSGLDFCSKSDAQQYTVNVALAID